MSSWSGVSARQWLARADRAHRREDMQDFIERAAAGALVEIAETHARRLERDQAIQRVRGIHAEGAVCIELTCGGDEDDCDHTHLRAVCVSCRDIDGVEIDYPCPTIAALEPLPSGDVIEVEIDTEAFVHHSREVRHG